MGGICQDIETSNVLETLLELGCDRNAKFSNDKRSTIGIGKLILADVDVSLQYLRDNGREIEPSETAPRQTANEKLVEILFSHGLRLPSQGTYARSGFRKTFSGLMSDEKISELLAVYNAKQTTTSVWTWPMAFISRLV
jgi:hypothetical protein